MTEIIIRMEHIRKSGMCSKGARAFFERHELDWQAFLKQGISSSALEKTGDHMALRVVEVARGRK